MTSSIQLKFLWLQIVSVLVLVVKVSATFSCVSSTSSRVFTSCTGRGAKVRRSPGLGFFLPLGPNCLSVLWFLLRRRTMRRRRRTRRRCVGRGERRLSSGD